MASGDRAHISRGADAMSRSVHARNTASTATRWPQGPTTTLHKAWWRQWQWGAAGAASRHAEWLRFIIPRLDKAKPLKARWRQSVVATSARARATLPPLLIPPSYSARPLPAPL
ncbi:unnamed protein product [Pieris brassicae]|uniref:Uncharacterized protein n=1 Tax=Pieris brassicae TaxID=7116 RepID=A0A9P0WX10_PIEBR|nr:unnamed protein product [Pieris brassicae]